MIDDDSNELIPSDGGGDNDENAEDGNADDVQSVSIIQDEQGITFLGDAGVIDLWLKSEGFDSKAFKAKAVQTVSMASKGAQKASDAMVESGRWVKLTKESAELVAKYGKNGKKGALQAGVVRQPNGRIIKHLKFTQPGQLNPAMLTGISGVMVQMALEQAVSEITDYLKDIDAKLDDLLRDQKDQTVSKLAGISHMIDETMLIYQQVGSISETTWSKVSSCPQDIATIQAYAIAKIKGLTEKVEREQDPKQIRPLTQQIRQEIHQWLGMLASAVKMQDQVSCIELARVCQGEYLQLSRPLIIPFQGHRYCQRRPVADRFKATDPLWSGFEHGLSVPLPHVELAGVDPYRVVHDAVEDGVGDGVAAETAVPFLGGQLGRERGAGVVVAQFHELKQEAPELLVGLVHEPFVDREQRVRGVFAHELGRTSRFEGRGRDLFREVGHPYVAGPVASPARGFHQRA